jgi:H+/Cl- antiporter ClcA
MFVSLWNVTRRVLWAVFALALIAFAIENRQLVTVSLGPLGQLSNIPVFLLLFLGIFIGLIAAGAVTGWLRLKGFTERRKAVRRANALEEQMSAMAEDAHQHRAGQAHSHVADAPQKQLG